MRVSNPSKTNRGGLTAVALIVVSTLQAFGQQPPLPPPEVREHLLHVAQELPADSVLRSQLEVGAHGDGVSYPWMDAAKRDSVKRAVIEINFTWHGGLHDLKVVRITFFTSYEGPSSQVTDPQQLAHLERDGLRASLEQAALDRARQGWWLESPEHQHPARKGPVPAATVILLYDDPWLPVLQPRYGIRDTTGHEGRVAQPLRWL
jgi:hypothetical protein